MKQPSVKASYTFELDHVTDKKKILNASFSDCPSSGGEII
jgi:hypothetical protein